VKLNSFSNNKENALSNMERLTTYFNHRFAPYILLCISNVYAAMEAVHDGDFFIFMEAARTLRTGGDLYTTTFGSGFHYFYSPLFARLLQPFSLLPFYVPKFSWLLLNIFFLYRIFKIIPQYLNLSLFSENQKTAFWVVSFALIARFVFINFHNLQMTIFLVYMLLEGVHLIDNKKEVKGSILLALAINIKIMPIIILPWLLYRRFFKASFYVVFFVVLSFFLSAMMIGWKYNMELHASWWHLINPSNKIHVIDIDEPEFHSLTTLFPTLLMENARGDYDLTLKRNIANLAVETVTVIIQLSRILLLLFTFYFLRSLPFRNVQSNVHQWWELSYIFLITPLIFPHQQFYAFFFLLPAFFYMVYYVILKYPLEKFLITALCVVFVLTSFIGGVLGFLRAFSSHYKLITYGSIILLFLLAYARPSKLSSVIAEK
jgi:hypothetical protein